MGAPVPALLRVVLIAPLPIPRAAMRALLESTARFEVVGEGGTAPDAAAMQAADVVVIDVPPRMEPASIIGTAAAAGDAAIVVVLDADDLSQCSAAIAAGAAGVVGRQDTPQTLFGAIERVYAGETSIERSVLGAVVRHSKRADVPADRYRRLSGREREVHALVTRGLHNKEIAERLFISDATVRHHLTSIFGKLGVSGRLELLASQWPRPDDRLVPTPVAHA